jgi:hypothetical protein
MQMETVTITDPEDRSYPFNKGFFDDPQILYHGSWSPYSKAIELEGFVHGALPFDWNDVAKVFEANQAIGRGSYLTVFLGARYPRESPPRDLSITGNFWFARAYATDGGGEVVRKTIEEARSFEEICTVPEKRAELKAHWQRGLQECPGHPATVAAIRVLDDEQVLSRLCAEVKSVRERLAGLTIGGFPVVYAVRVQTEWFGERWAKYLSDRDMSIRAHELRCSGDLVPPDRIIAKAEYPNGTDRSFMPTCFHNWEEYQKMWN